MGDPGFKFDFEHSLPTMAAPAAPTDLPPAMRKNYRQTVCRHWWRGMCMKGDDCGFLHQWEPSRMPICRFFAKSGECNEPNCVFKHSQDDIKDCNMYKLGFCIHGTLCRYRHKKEPGPPPLPEDVVRSRAPGADEAGGAAGRHTNQLMLPGRADGGFSGAPQHRTNAPPLPARAPLDHHSGALVLQERRPPSAAPSARVRGPSKVRAPPSGSARYFLMNCSSRGNLETAVRHGTWATSHRQNESKMNAAFDTSDNILLFFSINESHHFQGVAQMVSRVGDQAAQAATNPQWQGQQGRNFRLRWLKLVELPFSRTQHLHNPYNEDQPVQMGRDMQEIEPTVGAQMVGLIYKEAESDLQPLVDEGGGRYQGMQGADAGPPSGPGWQSGSWAGGNPAGAAAGWAGPPPGWAGGPPDMRGRPAYHGPPMGYPQNQGYGAMPPEMMGGMRPWGGGYPPHR